VKIGELEGALAVATADSTHLRQLLEAAARREEEEGLKHARWARSPCDPPRSGRKSRRRRTSKGLKRRGRGDRGIKERKGEKKDTKKL
jgi:hypothetical protein